MWTAWLQCRLGSAGTLRPSGPFSKPVAFAKGHSTGPAGQEPPPTRGYLDVHSLTFQSVKAYFLNFTSHRSGAQQLHMTTALGRAGLEHFRHHWVALPSHPSPYLAQRGCLLICTGHRVLYECGIGHIGGPGVPSVYEGGATLLVPLDADPKTFSPAESREMNLMSHGRPVCPQQPGQLRGVTLPSCSTAKDKT